MPDTPELIAARKKALELNKNVRTAPPITPRTGVQNSLGSILKDGGATFKYSDSGNGGAILVNPGPNMNGVGAAIKIESLPSVVNAQKCGQLMESFFKNATGTPPFAAPRTTVYGVDEFRADGSLGAGLKSMHSTLEKRGGITQARGFDFQKNALEEVSKGTAGVLVMEYADGKQIDKLPNDEKVGLVKSEAFARSLGRIMAPSMALGLVDHAGTGINNYAANITNLMYDSATGKISIIDYDGRARTSGDPPVVSVGVGTAHRELESMRLFLEDASQSPQKFEAALDRMVESMSQPGNKTPFTAMMRAFTPGNLNRAFEGPNRTMAKNKNLPLTQDELASQMLTPEDYREFAANLLAGGVEGLEYVKKNQQALETAVKQTHDVQHGQKVEHFYNDGEMQNLKNELGKLDADKLKNQMNQRMDERANAKKTQLGTYLTDLNKKEANLKNDLAALEMKITQKSQFPSAGDKLKTLFSSKDNTPLAKLNKEVQKIKEELATIDELKNVAQGKLAFHNKMEGQKNLQPQNAPSNTLGTQVPKVKTSLGKDTGVSKDPGKVSVKNTEEVGTTTQVRSKLPGRGGEKSGGDTLKTSSPRVKT